jgi:hypothetical protein
MPRPSTPRKSTQGLPDSRSASRPSRGRAYSEHPSRQQLTGKLRHSVAFMISRMRARKVEGVAKPTESCQRLSVRFLRRCAAAVGRIDTFSVGSADSALRLALCSIRARRSVAVVRAQQHRRGARSCSRHGGRLFARWRPSQGVEAPSSRDDYFFDAREARAVVISPSGDYYYSRGERLQLVLNSTAAT